MSKDPSGLRRILWLSLGAGFVGHAALAIATAWAFHTGDYALARKLTFGMMAWAPACCAATLVEVREAYRGGDRDLAAFPALFIVALVVALWFVFP